jgi:hypothetical protein
MIAYSASVAYRETSGETTCLRSGLSRIQVDGSGRRFLAQDASGPEWSPYGRRLAFAGNDRIGAGRGADDVDAGSGDDSITSDDESSLRRGARDTVRGGPGRDTVVADRRDRISRDCECVITRAL